MVLYFFCKSPRLEDHDILNVGEHEISRIVVFTKIPSSVTEAGNILHRLFSRVYQSLSRFTTGIMTQAPNIAQKQTEWQTEPAAE